MERLKSQVVWLAVAMLLAGRAERAESCPFCNAVSMTLSEEIKSADAAIIGRLIKLPPQPTTESSAADAAKATFEVVDVLKGPAMLEPKQKIEILYFGQEPAGSLFMIIGSDPKQLAWGTPTPLSGRAAEYVKRLPKLPEAGPKRLVFFLGYLEDKDSLLASDSYDEFAKTPYADVQAIKDQMPHEKLLAWIKSPDTSTSRRRLYLTMLGICGTPADVPFLKKTIETEDRQVRAALDALIACYLNLTGANGVGLVEDLFLKNKKAEYTDTYAAIMALRFHGQETTIVPRARLTEAMRYMLDRPQLADLVIPDLARWQDWSVMDRLVKLFKDADEDSIWVRVPVINYLRACPLPEAKQHIVELAKVDPEAVKRASQFFPLGGAAPPPGSQRAKADAGGPAPPPTPQTKANGGTDDKSSAIEKEPVNVAAATGASKAGTTSAEKQDTKAAALLAAAPTDKQDPPTLRKKITKSKPAASPSPAERPTAVAKPTAPPPQLVKLNKPLPSTPVEELKHAPATKSAPAKAGQPTVLVPAAVAGLGLFFLLLGILRMLRRKHPVAHISG